jgi:hypothetical protein
MIIGSRRLEIGFWAVKMSLMVDTGKKMEWRIISGTLLGNAVAAMNRR